MKASVKLSVFILASFFSLALSNPTCKAKPSPDDEVREQWRQRWTSTSAAADAGTTPDAEDTASPVVAPTPDEASPVADEAKSSHERTPEEAKSAAEETPVKEEASDVNETTAVDEAVVVEEVLAKDEEPATGKSQSSSEESSAEETNASSAKAESPEGSVVVPGDVASSAFSSAFSAYSSAHSLEDSESDWEYVSCTAAGGTPSNLKTLRFCYFEDNTVEICACPLKIFNDFELELDDIYAVKYSHYFEDNACYFKKKSQ